MVTTILVHAESCRFWVRLQPRCLCFFFGSFFLDESCYSGDDQIPIKAIFHSSPSPIPNHLPCFAPFSFAFFAFFVFSLIFSLSQMTLQHTQSTLASQG